MFKRLVELPGSRLPTDRLSGKTILTSLVVDHLSKTYSNQRVGVAVIYCNYKSQNEQTKTSLLGSLARQFLQQQATVPNKILEIYQKYHQRGAYTDSN